MDRPTSEVQESLSRRPDVAIRSYSEGDLPLLERTLGDPRMTKHLGGPEGAEKLRERHRKFTAMSADSSTGCIFVIGVGAREVSAGTVGYWEKEWDGQKVWETGWSVLPEFQGRGIATAAIKLVIERVTKLRSHRILCAFPSVENHPSNAICRKLGFTLMGETEYEYPRGSGSFMRCNNWLLDLFPGPREDSKSEEL
jgi:RimJ/RimL family protein N-acetyltransferase